MQTRLVQEKKSQRKWPEQQVNYVFEGIQRLETSRGCSRQCPFCYEPSEKKVWDIPNITKSKVQVLDMNFLEQPNPDLRICELVTSSPRGAKFELVCGVDFRLLTPGLARALHDARFGTFRASGEWYPRIRIAWDWGLSDQYKVKHAVKVLQDAGYRAGKEPGIEVFMIVNWRVPVKICERKLDLLKVWNVLVADCCFDGGYARGAVGHWNSWQRKEFRAKSRTHNQLVNFGIDPEAKK